MQRGGASRAAPTLAPSGAALRPGYKYCGGLGHGSRWYWTTAPGNRGSLRDLQGFRPRPRPLRPSIRTKGQRRAGQTRQRLGPQGDVLSSRALGPGLLSAGPARSVTG